MGRSQRERVFGAGHLCRRGTAVAGAGGVVYDLAGDGPCRVASHRIIQTLTVLLFLLFPKWKIFGALRAPKKHLRIFGVFSVFLDFSGFFEIRNFIFRKICPKFYFFFEKIKKCGRIRDIEISQVENFHSGVDKKALRRFLYGDYFLALKVGSDFRFS